MKTPLILLSLLAVTVLAGCGLESNDDKSPSERRFEVVSYDKVSNVQLGVYRDRKTGRQYLVTEYAGNHCVTLMPDDPSSR